MTEQSFDPAKLRAINDRRGALAGYIVGIGGFAAAVLIWVWSQTDGLLGDVLAYATWAIVAMTALLAFFLPSRVHPHRQTTAELDAEFAARARYQQAVADEREKRGRARALIPAVHQVIDFETQSMTLEAVPVVEAAQKAQNEAFAAIDELWIARDELWQFRLSRSEIRKVERRDGKRWKRGIFQGKA